MARKVQQIKYYDATPYKLKELLFPSISNTWASLNKNIPWGRYSTDNWILLENASWAKLSTGKYDFTDIRSWGEVELDRSTCTYHVKWSSINESTWKSWLSRSWDLSTFKTWYDMDKTEWLHSNILTWSYIKNTTWEKLFTNFYNIVTIYNTTYEVVINPIRYTSISQIRTNIQLLVYGLDNHLINDESVCHHTATYDTPGLCPGNIDNYISSIYSQLDAIETYLKKSRTDYPSGSIIIFPGKISDIPYGWYVCDGNNGTPDLREKVIICSGDKYYLGKTGYLEDYGYENVESVSCTYIMKR